jgi:hypothetical protein
MTKYALHIKGFLASLSLAIALLLSVQHVTKALADDPPLSEEATTCSMVQVCTGNFIPDNKDCGCQCGISACNDPLEVFNPTTCSCRREGEPNPACDNVRCPEGTIVDQDNCQCIEPPAEREAAR